MFKKILIVLVVLVAGVLGAAALQPDTFSVTRTATINAPPERIMPLIADFHNWTSWSPWEHLDPKMKRTYGGAVSGKGAVYQWEGNDDVGAGRMEITKMTAVTSLAIKLDFYKPFASTNVAGFILDANGGGTTVTWTMSGPMSFMSKLISVFVSMDKMIGKDFEKGLSNLKVVADKQH